MGKRGGDRRGGGGGDFEGEFSLHLFPNETRILPSQWRKLELSDLRGKQEQKSERTTERMSDEREVSTTSNPSHTVTHQHSASHTLCHTHSFYPPSTSGKHLNKSPFLFSIEYRYKIYSCNSEGVTYKGKYPRI